MHIAILTQPLHRNYGGILQAYALQTFLQKQGHKVVIINREYSNKVPIRLLVMRVCSVVKSFVRLFLLRQKEYMIMNPLSHLYHAKWSGYDILPFVKENIVHTKAIHSSKRLRKYITQSKLDCFIVGSDQVWRPCYSPCITDFFLKEVPADYNAVKVAYAASFGTDSWEFSDEDTEECASLAQIFDGISVREISGIVLCKDYLGVVAEHLLDPTMLLEQEDYIRLFENAKVPKSENNLFCYVLDDNCELDSIVSSLENDGYIPCYASTSAQPTKEDPRPYQLSVEEWLRKIYDAELVITDSFHACVFSIIFNKPFIVLGNKGRGNARFDSLLEMFGLQERLVESYDCFLRRRDSLVQTLDVASIKRRQSELKAKSLDFFKKFNITKQN